MALTRDQLKLASLPKETVNVASLGGEVIVRALTLSERLNLYSVAVGTDNGFEHIAKLLNVSVIDPNGFPLLTADEWEQFGGQEMADTLNLFDVVRRLSGLESEVVAKN